MHVECLAEAGLPFLAGPVGDVRNSSLLFDLAPEPRGVTGLVREDQLSPGEARQQVPRRGDIVRLPLGERQPDGQAVPVGDRMDPGGQASSTLAQTSIRVAFFKVAAEW